MGAKTNYDDPTIAKDPPGGKHHETQKEGKKLPTDRHNGHDHGQKAVSTDNVANAEK